MGVQFGVHLGQFLIARGFDDERVEALVVLFMALAIGGAFDGEGEGAEETAELGLLLAGDAFHGELAGEAFEGAADFEGFFDFAGG